jgi:phage terminase large subunit
MKLDLNNVFLPALQQDKRYYLICGGRSGGRSYFASQYALGKLIKAPYFRCAIMRFVLGDIRTSIYQEIIDRIEEQELENAVTVTANNLLIVNAQNFIKGIGFRKSSGDQKAKMKSLASFTDIIIEEAEEVSEEDFMQLDDSLRTTKSPIRIFLLFNLPPKAHWINKKWFNLEPIEGIEGYYQPTLKESEKHNTCFIHSTYLDNIKNLNHSTVVNFKNYEKTKPDHFHNMIMGRVSDGARGLIYKNWKPISDKEYEELDYPVFYGTDFGFTNDPAGVVEIKMHNDNVYVRELIYETGLINIELSKRMEQKGVSKIAENYGDSAEPKSITEIQTYGWNMLPSEKGKGSRKAGVHLLLGKNVFYTESSTNLITEKENYCWALNRDKEPTNEPADGNDHLLDALRGAVFTKSKQPYIGVA